MTEIQNLIGGEFKPAGSRKTLENFEPATGKVYATIPDSDETDVDAAAKAAAKAAPEWARTPAAERARILRKVADRVAASLDELARAEAIDNGKPMAVAKWLDIPRSSTNLNFFADAVAQFATETHTVGDSVLSYTLRQPIGTAGIISPWNLPLYLFTWKIAPAIAAGNTVVAKPSEITPMTAYLFSKMALEAGLPPGVLNVVHGLGAKVGSAISRHPKIRAVSFTGSTRTGREILRESSPFFKKVSLEMGGKNPTLVFADCRFEETVNEVARSAFSNQGQICLCGSRILVEKSIYSKFRDALLERISRLKLVDPLEPADPLTIPQGAVVSKAHYEKILGAIAKAKSEGGKILIGGKAGKVSGRCENGWFVEPTLIEGLPSQCETNQEEIFGPVATLIPFENEAEAVQLANDTRYGLATSVWTRDLDRAHRLGSKLDFGVVWTNCWMLRDLRTPFGGMKESGVGREGGLESLRFFTEPKSVFVQVKPEAQA